MAAAGRKAVCIIRPDGGSDVKGLVVFTQAGPNAKTKIVADLTGLKAGKHGFHIHQFGDLTSGCKSAGGHFNPHGKEHGGPGEANRHVGDLGNIVADQKGEAHYEAEDDQVTLYGDNTIIGRSVVVHADPDDLGKGGHEDSKTTGHAGARRGCGTIGLAKL
uniref:Superoxide dismutase [Cu-Zn] n=1 Tax=Coccolithus braarudii TaxID=221442 RepID=A0A7S0PYP3_9EUKA|mmetsp:Transcript_23150/g.49952  ORF Transcript_23150/g.49952 Transcript_23150/m.49952 type:complete len:161 (+) Transcript_23150:81-563(+)|eukprot:CAMPEP_0183355066 /NCGR_PEP_ID=MMETSP0164_2-20130417/39082_1 /TAXON_ID=221442 /ORGANISM="Coccolithus pelagicus ssp braarudi, Strain PLY182g" /LENGTH=160 /DNA_ID=CAMNT_0025528081 /DNA_START=81 /DNA_END=563 /DNA_ORIENTATION=+